MTFRTLAAAAAAAILILPNLVQAEPTPLPLAYPAPPRGRVTLWVVTPWSEEITQASEGTIEIKVYPGPALGTFNNIFDRVQNGVADIAYGTVGAVSSQFPKTEVASLPFAAEGAV